MPAKSSSFISYLKNISLPRFPSMILCLMHLMFFSICNIQSLKAQKNDSCSIEYLMVDKDNLYNASSLKLKNLFLNKNEANNYISSLLTTLLKMGFTSASIDSSWIKDKTIFLKLYLGQKIERFLLNTDSLEKEVKLDSGKTICVYTDGSTKTTYSYCSYIN